MKKFLIGTGVVLALIVGGAACGGEDESATPSPKPSQTQKVEESPAPAPKETKKESPKVDEAPDRADSIEEAQENRDKNAAEMLKGFANDKGTPQEREAASHVNKVQDNGSDALIPMADIHTNLSGDMFGPNGDVATLLVSLYMGLADEQGFATSDGGGLVTVYNANGEVLTLGNF